MKYTMRVAKNGVVTTDVGERGATENCADIIKVTARLGRQISEEKTGPDCDPAVEVQNQKV